MAGCDDNMYKPEDPVEVKGLVLSEEYANGYTVAMKQTFSIAGLVTVSPVNASNKAENFTSSDPLVATVDGNGKVLAISEGTTDLIITVGEHSVKFTLTVIHRFDVDVTAIKFTQDELVVFLTDNANLFEVLQLAPMQAEYMDITFTSSDPDVATVDETGLVTPKATGETTITATSNADATVFDNIKINVVDRITAIEFKTNKFEPDVAENINLFTEDELQLRLTPANVSPKNLIFTSSKPAVATVDIEGNVTCIAPGKTTITVTAKNDPLVSASVAMEVFAVSPGFTIDADGKVTKYDGPGGDIRVPRNGKIINGGVFKQKNAVTSVHLNKVTEVGNEGFRESKEITSVIAPNLVALRNSVFQECVKLDSIEMENVTVINQFTFYGTKLKKVYMPALKTITDRKNQFAGCLFLEEVDMPNLTGIGADDVFSGCVKLKTVKMPKLNTFAIGTNGGTGVGTFKGCTALEEISLPSVTMLKNNIFTGCTALKKLDLSSATGLTSVTATAVPDQAGLNIYVATNAIKDLFTGTNYTVNVGTPTP